MIKTEIHICNCIDSECNSPPSNRLVHVDGECIHLDGTRHKIKTKKYDEHKKYTCQACNTEVELYWEPQYNVIRGKCPNCGTNWAES